MVNTLVSPRPILLLLSAPSFLSPQKVEGPGVLPEVTFSAFEHAKMVWKCVCFASQCQMCPQNGDVWTPWTPMD